MSLSAARTNFANMTSLQTKIGRPTLANKVFYNGAMVALALASRYLKPNDGTAGDLIVGCIDTKNHPSLDTTGQSNGDSMGEVITGIFPFAIGASADALAQADVGNYVYGIDDTTVGKTDGGTGRPRAGQLIRLETLGGVSVAWVAIGIEWPMASIHNGSVDAVNAAGAISPNTDITELSINGTMVFTIAAPNRLGQRKVVTTVAATGTPVGTLTSSASNVWTTVSGLGAAFRCVEFEAVSVAGVLKWDLVGGFGVTVA